jgi:hypothetical protein
MALTKIKTGSVSDSITLTTPDINGGTIDATLIGGTTPAAISGTTGTFSSTVRATGTTVTSAPSATLSFSGTTSRLESRGADVSTRGAIQLMQATSNGSSEIVALGFDAAGTASFIGDIILPSTGKLYSSGDTDSYLQFNQANTLRAIIGDSTRMIIEPNSTVFNEDGADVDFRVESDGNANAFLLNGANGNIGIGTTTASKFEINHGQQTGALGLASATMLKLGQATGAPAVGNVCQMAMGYGNTYSNIAIAAIRTSATAYGTDDLVFAVKDGTTDKAPPERLRIRSNGGITGTCINATTSEYSGSLDDLKKTGFYRSLNSNTNNPSYAYYSVVVYGNQGNVTAQIATLLSGPATYVRSFNNNWTSWVRIDD